MPKAKGRDVRPKGALKAAPKGALKAVSKAASTRAGMPEQRRSGSVEHAEAPPRRARAEAMQLAAEVARLERELVAARAQLADLTVRAEIDPLTEILNRRGFERALGRALAYVKRHGTSAALLYVDLDHFKRVNDRHGHAAGDAVLKAVAMLLVRHVRMCDLVARIGGDEFVLLLWNCSAAAAQAKAAALEAAIMRTTATHAGATMSVGASCGVALLLPLDRPADLLERADRAMYARKAARGGIRQVSGG